ncbi:MULTISPECIES: 3-oxoacyl-[acyl-carrier-protein] reductase [Bacillota]|jgi:3-oxoacyl-[acyl-carrier protein] reductase|uniref:3-oxoacyl-[acyl-carrier-protein] reductase n=1 Tax=Clostridium tertium TaxID=1559 RepID=A0A9X3XI84_9CLOT|nr:MULTISPECIES: 3-oxoacyl-[acyl-carrier-protein] reductase [Bacillota]EEH98722.1 3-oxoacyl-[acyl-carrier-protein] reductase [Clostridium sp. 7_2_43FAA]MBU6136297.1 3-oxoacyl-[acyl-carrier-protein] reductase [Clostridium tertium]MDB1940334.1 3-oxoacyl-[acyl-carrier-protein] reductase [Clostridium tertium]MDB1946714.1 3-oxoacyl-[acyl-carrier-protein] reductase [Clostridium tertium]MDB1954471.1 3-oxoacyl-[acyl-carrier-protein] reductase [Clostridium tertium]
MVKDKNAIVTGGTRGIGREIARTLAQNGANIAINYRKYNEEVESLIEELKSFGVKVVACKCDVSNEEEVINFIKEVKDKFESIDILVNNAGITKDGLIIRMSEKDFDDVIDVNLKGTFNTTKAVSSIMVKQRYGKIINISSVVGVAGNAGQCNYAASKAGVIGFSKSVARELAARNINVNVIAPGYINTDMTSVLPDRVKEEVIKTIPMKKIGEPKEIANLVLFLSSNLSNYITGQVINVDGGMVML